MTETLGIDFGARMAARFGGRLYPATLTRNTPGAYDPEDPTGAAEMDSDSYACSAIALGYAARYVDGERIVKGDFRVMIIRGTIAALMDDSAKAALDLDDVTANVDTIVRARAGGAAGNLVTIELVDDASLGAGALVESGTNVRLSYLPGVTTVAELETLIAGSVLLEVDTAGTGATVVELADRFGAVALAGGVDASSELVDVVPQPGDEILIPPPGSATASTGAIVNVDAITEAFFTVQVRGAV